MQERQRDDNIHTGGNSCSGKARRVEKETWKEKKETKKGLKRKQAIPSDREERRQVETEVRHRACRERRQEVQEQEKKEACKEELIKEGIINRNNTVQYWGDILVQKQR